MKTRTRNRIDSYDPPNETLKYCYSCLSSNSKHCRAKTQNPLEAFCAYMRKYSTKGYLPNPRTENSAAGIILRYIVFNIKLPIKQRAKKIITRQNDAFLLQTSTILLRVLLLLAPILQISPMPCWCGQRGCPRSQKQVLVPKYHP